MSQETKAKRRNKQPLKAPQSPSWLSGARLRLTLPIENEHKRQLPLQALVIEKKLQS